MLVVVVMHEIQGMTSVEDAESFMLKRGKNIICGCGSAVGLTSVLD